jgi:hypothetical protein
MTDIDSSATNDVFVTSRYAELVENPIMYSKPDHTSFTDGINISVYSPTGKIGGKHNARDENDDDCTKKFLGK